MSLSERLEWLKQQGCKPCLSCRGKIWRAHVNLAGNFWADADTPKQALEAAMELWKEKGMPLDEVKEYY